MTGPLRLDEASAAGRASNNFDLLRLIAATLVVFDHSFALTRTRPGLGFAETATGTTWGAFGVLIFFSISGYLVSRSWTYDPRPASYAAKRALRLLPALVISLFLTAFVLGPLVTTLQPGDYLQAPATRSYVLLNSMMSTVYELPGVFGSNAYPHVVNGSLWTLPLEVKAYFLIAVVGLAGAFRRRRGGALVVAVAVVACLWTIDGARNSLPLGNRGLALLSNPQGGGDAVSAAATGTFDAWANVFAAFAIGAALFALRRWVRLRWDLAAGAALIVVVAIASGPATARHAIVFLMPFAVLLAAYRTGRRVRLPRRFGDYSYGVYILAFPIQQAIYHWLAPASGWVMFAIALPVSLALAALSWHLIEAPALTLKQRLGTRRVDARVQLEPLPVAD